MGTERRVPVGENGRGKGPEVARTGPQKHQWHEMKLQRAKTTCGPGRQWISLQSSQGPLKGSAARQGGEHDKPRTRQFLCTPHGVRGQRKWAVA